MSSSNPGKDCLGLPSPTRPALRLTACWLISGLLHVVLFALVAAQFQPGPRGGGGAGDGLSFDADFGSSDGLAGLAAEAAPLGILQIAATDEPADEIGQAAEPPADEPADRAEPPEAEPVDDSADEPPLLRPRPPRRKAIIRPAEENVRRALFTDEPEPLDLSPSTARMAESDDAADDASSTDRDPPSGRRARTHRGDIGTPSRGGKHRESRNSVIIPAAGNGAGDVGGGKRRGAGTGAAAATFFDLPGHGSRFVYVIDCSSSMRPRKAFATARRELLESLERLSSSAWVQVIFYNDLPQSAAVDSGRPTLVRNTAANRAKIARNSAELEPEGGTNHLSALEMALRFDPDAIFLLTDADEPVMTPADLNHFRRLNRRGVPVQAVEFGTGPLGEDETFLMRLARESGGAYRYCDLDELAAPPERESDASRSLMQNR